MNASSVKRANADTSAALLFATRVAGLVNDHALEPDELGRELLPEPVREVLTGRVFEPLDVVQVVVIELVVQGLPNRVELTVVDEPTRFGVHGAAHHELDF